jgi:CDP-paratose synthetase
MRILLSGPGGFLGSALARFWVERGHELWLLARPSSRLERLEGLLASVRVLRATEPDQIKSAINQASPQAIVHTACSYGRKGESPLDVMDANLRLGTAMLAAVLEGPAGQIGPVSFLNTGTVLEPDVSLYALSKTQFSRWGSALSNQSPSRLRFIDIRLQQMYGCGDDRSKFTMHVIETCRRNEPRLALTAGNQLRDFIHVDDVVRAYDFILQHHEGFAASDIIDVGSGETVTMRQFVELVKRLAGSTTELDFGAVPYRPNEAMLCVADTSRLRSLGWQPRMALEDGLRSVLGTPSHVRIPEPDRILRRETKP